MSVGIDRISYYCPKYFTSTESYANFYNKNYKAIVRTSGQLKNSFKTANEDIISFGINAAKNIIQENEKFDAVIFATESSLDDSKCSTLFLTNYLNINKDALVFEIKQACYSSTAALIFAINYIQNKKDAKILIISSDIAEYKPDSNGEITNGAGAVAFIVSNNPKILEIENKFYSTHEDAYDFLKPKEEKYPIVNGQESVNLYLKCFHDLYERLIKENENKKINIIVNHAPFANILNKIKDKIESDYKIEIKFTEEIKNYTSNIGNLYTASLYLSFISLLKNSKENLTNKEIIFFAYGSGATATIFKGKIMNSYTESLNYIQNYIEDREEVEYYKIESVKKDNNLKSIRNNTFYLEKVEDFRRYYKCKED